MDFDTVKQNLVRNGFAVQCFADAAQAMDYLDTVIDGTTVGMGGSVTLAQMGAYDRLSTHNTVYSHALRTHGDDTIQLAATAEVYLSSVNGLAQTGEIVNIDGFCNRVSGIMFGHRRVFLVVGRNKLAPDYDAAVYRARNIAAPRNAQRLGRQTPCAVKADHCYNCHSPQRICRALSVLWTRPMGSEYTFLLIDEDLGY